MKSRATTKPLSTSKRIYGCMPGFSGKSKTLAALVLEYQKSQEPESEKTWNSQKSLLEAYRELSDLKTSILNASFAHDLVGKRYRNGQERPTPKRHGHQWRLKKADMEKALMQLRSKISKVKAYKLFEEIHECVWTICSPINGLGKLYIYDTALRIGSFLRLMPKRVYLQAGALAGARALGLDVKNSPLPVEDFPEALRILKAHEIEDFLCIYKDHLTKFKS